MLEEATDFLDGLKDRRVAARTDVEGVASAWESDGTAWMTPSTWHGQAVLRISVSNWRTTDEDIDRTLNAVRRVLADVSAGRPSTR